MNSAVSLLQCAASSVASTVSPSCIPSSFARAFTWVVSLVPSGTLTCATVMASSWSMAEKSVTLPFSSVHAPRITLPSMAITHLIPPSSSLYFLACARSHFPVILSSSAASILVSTVQITV